MLKRLFDIGLSGAGIIGSSPLWLLFGLVIWLQDRGPVFYGQERVGKNGRIFRAMKFRSMIRDAEKHTGPIQATEDDARITRVGKFLRATAMDELPQLWNIFKGDMSFVGPRALRPKEKEVHGSEGEIEIEKVSGYHERLKVTPGLTGPAQIYLATDALRKEKFRYDLEYIENQSFLYDLRLIILSFYITFRGKWQTRENKLSTPLSSRTYSKKLKTTKL
jgi:lipopolysaccharide/colanic/teichoic acid biosynthesis glycosyltransferase